MPWPLTERVPITRRRAVQWGGAALALFALGGCDSGGKWHEIDVSESSPPLSFTMTRASDGKKVTQADYRGRLVMLYFGYTYCSDLCPTTLSNIATVLQRLGPEARDVSVLFVTVDPNRDTRPVLASYVKAFAPEIDGLRGTPDQLAALARRYRVVYSVTPATEGQPYEVTHSSAIYVFDRAGNAQLLVPSMASTTPDLSGTTADLQKLVSAPTASGLLAWLRQLV
ncbi:MAG TPA: SCO family protein [Stellaceae bacterium]|nr:SCO family protein [Stellaceae bacterium]